tara:strand:- start:427 stop:600 length:174 start_codon:yes stop_codon:yes gene_type:complete
MIEYVILALIVMISGYQSFQYGIREGAERTLRKLTDEGIIFVKAGGNILPNKFYTKD